MMWILLWILFGALVGWVASMLTGNNRRMGLVTNVVVGLLGALIGGWLSTVIGIGTYAEFSLGGFVVALIGAALLLALANMVSRRR